MENSKALSNKVIAATYLFERETEFLGWTPLSYVDSVIAVVHKYVNSALNSLQQFIDGELKTSMENEIGMQMTSTLLESAVDKSFDKWELYCLRQVFRIPKQAEICQFKDTDWSITAEQEHELDSRTEDALSKLAKLRKVNEKLVENRVYIQKRMELLGTVTKAMDFLPTMESVSALPNECQLFATEMKNLIKISQETKVLDPQIEAIANLYQQVKSSKKVQDSTSAQWDVSTAIKEEQLYEKLMKQIPLKDFENPR